MTNRLAQETSPYLLQHADNPVDWYPWGSEALDLARIQDKPILLSVGYAACHWCHVMAHETFENEAIAKVMNEHFVNIKVDREERPDIDAIYMQAVQSLTGQGGWPMTVFLTPFGEPFFGGTYYPPEDLHGIPGFRRVLQSVAEAFRSDRDGITRSAKELLGLYSSYALQAQSEGALTPPALDIAYRGLAQQYDVHYHGFSGAPKFPQAMSLDFLLRYWHRTDVAYALQMVHDSFRAMARGGIYDQVGGGFHRYTVDAHWIVPHFEKMLYDNALLIRLGAHLWQATRDDEVRRVVEETARWVEREMTSPEGGFYSSLDADSEGEEGKFYVWTPAELDKLLGSDSPSVKEVYGVTAGGNFDGMNILHLRTDLSVAAVRAGISRDLMNQIITDAKETLYTARSKRVWPARDEKVLAGWNGLMLRGLAAAARIFDDSRIRGLALRNGEFLLREMIVGDRVMRTRTGGRTRISGFLEDYAGLGLGFIALYEMTFDPMWVRHATRLANSMIEWFWDEELGAFFDTPSDAEALIARPRDPTDNATPSGTSLAADLLLTLSELGNDKDMRRRATFVLETLATACIRYPASFGHMLGVADMAANGAVEVAIAGKPGENSFTALERAVAGHYVPSLVLAGGKTSPENAIALLDGKESRGSKATAYVCRQYACEAPTSDPGVLSSQLQSAGKTSTTHR